MKYEDICLVEDRDLAQSLARVAALAPFLPPALRPHLELTRAEA